MRWVVLFLNEGKQADIQTRWKFSGLGNLLINGMQPNQMGCTPLEGSISRLTVLMDVLVIPVDGSALYQFQLVHLL